MRTTTWIVEPHRLSAADRQALADEMYATHCRVFSGVDRETFGRYVVDSPAHSTRIQLMRDSTGRLRGYVAFHVFLQRHLGRDMAVVRIEIGAEPGWRGGTFSGRFIAANFLRTLLRHPRRQVCFMACFVHPSAYVSLMRHLPSGWPRAGAELSWRHLRLMQSLADAFRLAPASRPGTYHVGWRAIDDTVAPTRISDRAAFFLQRNPDYREGIGLMTIARVDRSVFIDGFTSYLRFISRRRLGARFTPARTPRRVVTES